MLLEKDRSLLWVVDLQERLLAAMGGAQELLANVARLLLAADLWKIPVIATEQYPKGLGSTVFEAAVLLPPRLEKLVFSCARLEEIRKRREDSRTQMVLTGVETHVCILQTALELQEEGFAVYVVEDATQARKRKDGEAALRRLAQHGVSVVTTEMVLMEWTRRAGTPQFKQISSWLKKTDREILEEVKILSQGQALQ